MNDAVEVFKKVAERTVMVRTNAVRILRRVGMMLVIARVRMRVRPMRMAMAVPMTTVIVMVISVVAATSAA